MTAADPLIVFLHIPRTGGTTLRWSVLSQLYPEEQLYHVPADQIKASLQRFCALPTLEQQAYRVIHGHMGFGIHNLLDCPVRYVTFLRNPIDLHISNYYYITTNPTHPSYQSLTSQAPTFAEYVANALNPHIMTKRLCSEDGVFISGQEPIDETHLKKAKEHLRQHFSVIGLTDRYADSLACMRQRFGWASTDYQSLNGTQDKRPPREQIAPELLERINERCQYDVELYRYAQELFQAQLLAAGLVPDAAK